MGGGHLAMRTFLAMRDERRSSILSSYFATRGGDPAVAFSFSF